eukprot:16272339-Heterocapsa_arctica.AAC.1
MSPSATSDSEHDQPDHPTSGAVIDLEVDMTFTDDDDEATSPGEQAVAAARLHRGMTARRRPLPPTDHML